MAAPPQTSSSPPFPALSLCHHHDHVFFFIIIRINTDLGILIFYLGFQWRSQIRNIFVKVTQIQTERFHIIFNKTKRKTFFFAHFFQNCADYETLARLRSPAASLQLFCGFFAGGRPATSSPTSKFLVVFLRQSAPTKHPLSRPCFSRPFL